MPELIIHFAVPFFMFSHKLGLKRSILVALIALLPDLDVLFHVHRSVTHSLVILLVFSIPLAIALYLKKPNEGSFIIAGIISLISHPILDVFQTYTPILYPLLPYSLNIRLEGRVLISSNIMPFIEVGVNAKPSLFPIFYSMDAPVFTSEGLIISIFLMISSLWIMKSRRRSYLRTDYVFDPPDEEVIEKIDDLTIVIPTLNEANAIGFVIDELRSLGYRNILVVDGYSKDGTVEIAKSKRVKVIMQTAPGKGGAILTAIREVKTPYMLVMDGDGTYDPKYIKNIYRIAKDHDYDEVIGVRVEGRENIPLLNRFGNWLINKVFKILMGRSISDVCSGMYLLKTDFAKTLDITSESFDVEVEIAAQAVTYGSLGEVPIKYRRRIGEQKLKSFKHGLRIFMTILWMVNRYNPVLLYSSILALSAIPALFILSWVLYENFVRGVWHSGYALFGVMLLLLASQAASVSVISLLIKRLESRVTKMLKEKRKR